MLRKLCITDNKNCAGQVAFAVRFFAFVLGVTPFTTTAAPATTEPHFLSLFNSEQQHNLIFSHLLIQNNNATSLSLTF